MQSLHRSLQGLKYLIGGTITGIALVLLRATGVGAVERIVLEAGPFRQTIAVADLVTFADQGTVPGSLAPYRPLLTPQVRSLLRQPLPLKSDQLDLWFSQLRRSPLSDPLLQQLQAILPGMTLEDLQGAMALVLQQGGDLNLLRLLALYPGEELRVNLAGVVGLGLQWNQPSIESQALQSLLGRELYVEAPPWRVTKDDPDRPGPLAIRQQQLQLYDPQRRRALTLEIYDPPQDQAPLVVMSHGFAANRLFLNYLGRHLASYGWRVVSVEHPGSNVMAIGEGLPQMAPQEFLDRPRDLTFVLNELARLNGEPGPFYRRFATDRVTVIGHSLGGTTALTLGGAVLDLEAIRQRCQSLPPLNRSPSDWLACEVQSLPAPVPPLADRRVARLVLLNPLIGDLFGEQGLGAIRVPVLLLSAGRDGITPGIAHQLRPFSQLRQATAGQSYLLIALGATHMSATDPSYRASQVGQSPLLQEVMGNDAAPLRRAIAGLSVAFLAQDTPQGDRYRAYLGAAYSQYFSQGAIALRWTEALPPKVQWGLAVLAQGQAQLESLPRRSERK